MKFKFALLLITMLSGISQFFAQGDIQEDIAMIKSNLATSAANLKKYEWIETTNNYYKGEVKSKKQNQCYYSVDGKLTKVETGGSTDPGKTPGGLRGKAIQNKKDEIADYMTAAVAKIQTYLPPDGNKLQQIFAVGKVSIGILDPGKKFKLDFPDYNEKGDLLSISLDKEHKLIMAVAVNTYIDDPAQKVMFDIKYNTLPDGTQYAATTTLDAQAKEVKISIENSGYKVGAGH